MDETLFYVFGLGLVFSALAVSAIGLRLEGFPSSGAVLVAVIVYFAGMVGATTTFAVLNARDQAHEREAKEAKEAAAEAPSGGTTTTQTTTGAAPAPAPAKGSTLKLAADPEAIAYDTTKLSGSAGKVTIDFTNPSAVTHDVCLTSPSGDEIGCSPTISQDSASLTEDLKPGSYTFFCSVDGHEAAGMKGTLTIK
ncbi:MAG TPA: plastocyanin/azurin family copper-binding protein [Solirubrobacterales bacterium]|jgi:plastocyanin